MITETVLPPAISILNAVTKVILITNVSEIIKDGLLLTTVESRASFVPGQIELVKTHLNLGDESAEIVYINSMWTEEVIDNYNAI